MSMTNKILIFIYFLSLSVSSCAKNSDNLLGDDIRLFKKVAWRLAQTVEQEDTIRIKKILPRGKIDVDVREPKFGMTLLIWAVSENKYHSDEILLRYGSDPNLQDTSEELSAIIAAADKYETSEYLKLILSYGGDPNNCAKSGRSIFRPTPLIAASRTRLESVKLLVESGAEINYFTQNNTSALKEAVMANRPNIVKYLLIDQKAEFRKSLLTTIDGEEL